MRRLFWLAMGITIGALIVRKISRAAEKLTPSGMAAGIGQGLIRLAVGLDHCDDLQADLLRGLSTLPT